MFLLRINFDEGWHVGVKAMSDASRSGGGKPKGRHPDKRLTPPAIRAAGPGRHADGNGLYLEVDASGARRWVLRTLVHGRRRDIGLGGAQVVGLAQARELAARLRRVAR
ncbi:MAG: Arm DNA-binding domain-containing protein [Pseudomonadota bacterium]|nr:Arm DNA-binding domain-containing protein [Pseudomonadota bacterium]